MARCDGIRLEHGAGARRASALERVAGVVLLAVGLVLSVVPGTARAQVVESVGLSDYYGSSVLLYTDDNSFICPKTKKPGGECRGADHRMRRSRQRNCRYLL